jgi:hypothetical protein
MWIITGQFNNVGDPSWLDEFKDYDMWSIYLTSTYFIITTVATIGYGDIHGISSIEKIANIIIMVFGVISFSYATGSLSSIISNYD